jgi:hypothetical protein
MSMPGRRRFLTRFGVGTIVAGSGLMAAASASEPQAAMRNAARKLPASNPQFNLRCWARLNADLSGRTLYTCVTGMVYGFLPQADDVSLAAFGRRLYGYASLTARQVRAAKDDEIRFMTQSWNCYTDASSGAFIDTLLNPYTDKMVQCAPRASAPVESSQTGRALDLHYTTIGDRVWVRREGFARFKPPDITWFKLEADFLTHSARLDDLLDAALDHVPNECQHNLVAEWQTWMNMHGSPGHILFVGAGTHLRDPADVPPVLAQTIAARFPGTLDATRNWSPHGRNKRT